MQPPTFYQRAKPVMLPEPSAAPGPAGVAEAQALIDAFRQGQWHVEMLPVLCHVLTNMKPHENSFAGAVPGLQLIDTNDHSTHFGFSISASAQESRQIKWQEEPQESIAYFTRWRFDQPWIGPLRGHNRPVGLMRAYCALVPMTQTNRYDRLSLDPDARAVRLHGLIGELLLTQVTFVRLCMTLHRMWPDHPRPDILLRQCLQGASLTWEGQQVLDPALVRRPLKTGQAVAQLLELQCPAGERRRMLFELGYPMLQAHQWLGPIGPTPLAAPRSRVRSLNDGLPALRMEGAWLLHTHGTWKRLMIYLGTHMKSLRQLVGEEELTRWWSEALVHATASKLALPERPASPAPGQ